MVLEKAFKTGIFGNGGDFSYFARDVKWIAEFVRANELQAITSIKAETAAVGIEHVKAAPAASAFRTLDIRGGIRLAHLHFDNKIYLLDAKQWAEVSQKIVAECQASLAKAKTISFDEALVLGSMFER
jgi:hypothetical protein